MHIAWHIRFMKVLPALSGRTMFMSRGGKVAPCGTPIVPAGDGEWSASASGSSTSVPRNPFTSRKDPRQLSPNAGWGPGGYSAHHSFMRYFVKAPLYYSNYSSQSTKIFVSGHSLFAGRLFICVTVPERRARSRGLSIVGGVSSMSIGEDEK